MIQRTQLISLTKLRTGEKHEFTYVPTIQFTKRNIVVSPRKDIPPYLYSFFKP